MADLSDVLKFSMLSTLPQTLLGTAQTAYGFLSRKPQRPGYTIPGSATKALANAEMQALQTRLPGQSAIEGRLDRQTANTLSTIERLGGSPVGNINAAARAYGSQLDKETELGIDAAKMFRENQGILRNELDRYAGYEQKKWDWDVGDPYKSKMAELSAMKGAGLTNLTGGLQSLLGSLGIGAMVDLLTKGGAGGAGGGVAGNTSGGAWNKIKLPGSVVGSEGDSGTPSLLDGMGEDMGILSPGMPSEDMKRKSIFDKLLFLH